MQLSGNPTYSGPGVWINMHLTTLYARTKTEKNFVVKMIELTSRTFPCMECRKHIQEYIEMHPLDSAVENVISTDQDGHDISLFEWTVDFHNAVNKRLKKKVYTVEEAYKLYSNMEKEGCRIGNCLDDGKPQQKRKMSDKRHTRTI